MTFYNKLPEYATMIDNPIIIGNFDLLQGRTNIHPITVNSGQLHKLSFMVNPNTEQLIVRMSFSTVPLEYPVDGWFKSISPNGMTVYLYDQNTEFPPPPEMIIQNKMAGSFKISPKQIPVEPGQYYLNMQNLSNVQTSYAINIQP